MTPQAPPDDDRPQDEGHRGDGEVVRILGLEDPDERARFRRPQEWRLGRSEVPVDEFRQRVTAFLESMRSVVASAPRECGAYELNEITVSAEVSAKGQISLLGSGGELAGAASLTFTFTRKEVPTPEAAPDDDQGSVASRSPA